ncbi:putative selenate ABC transporter substrate-binding protein [Massilia sp. Dwa41.01b]|uniref:putative selenate ABC transporter substrate-binding protein n=1 Tax=unclassified Massilia TaxID=2609279 RepID=UPI00160073C3|nr:MULTISPECIES: putative selenate ABC transporter substrate-binding protein [unclassified Massilia]QNA88648.1 putative selenate ABC transporter substrate-binding protein [Massilia sp. Dwa41.01b]QNA99544.1 putative selenate ABC transporter substrate-binding protein [Massilia sp. Se16.2.3]
MNPLSVSKSTFKSLFAAAATASLLFAAGHAAAQNTPGVLRVSAIPDEAPTELQRKFKPLGDYLAKATGLKVEFTPVTDYAASVEGLVNKKLDMVWFGGFTFVQAKVRSKGQVVPLVQRAEDEKFRSVFITTKADINKLEDLRGKTLSFGSESSTSGHLMPRSFLLTARIDPDTDLKRVAFSGAHDATVAAVAGGKVDAGALNISVWEKLVEAGKVDPKAVRVFYTTPGYFDYNWSVRSDMNPALQKKIRDAFLALDASTAQGKEILELQRATKFVPTRAENYVAIEAAAKNAGLLK